MYYSFYGLKENAFKITPDPRFLFLSETHKEALAALVYGLEEGHTFLLLTGKVGTGKTIVLESFRANGGPTALFRLMGIPAKQFGFRTEWTWLPGSPGSPFVPAHVSNERGVNSFRRVIFGGSLFTQIVSWTGLRPSRTLSVCLRRWTCIRRTVRW